MHATKPVSRLAITIRTQSGDVVLDGEAWCYRMQPARTAERAPPAPAYERTRASGTGSPGTSTRMRYTLPV